MVEPTTHQMIEATALLIEAHGREEWAYYLRLCKREIPDAPTSGGWPMKKASKCLDRCELKAVQGFDTCEQQQMCNELGLEVKPCADGCLIAEARGAHLACDGPCAYATEPFTTRRTTE